MSRSYISPKTGKPYYGAPADEHHRKLMGFKSSEEAMDAAFDAGYDSGYKEGRRVERENWKANREAETRRSQIKAS